MRARQRARLAASNPDLPPLPPRPTLDAPRVTTSPGARQRTPRDVLHDLETTGVVWDVGRVGRPLERAQGVAVLHYHGHPLGVYLEVGPPDPRRERLARVQGWIYVAFTPAATRDEVIAALLDHARAIEAALGIRHAGA